MKMIKSTNVKNLKIGTAFLVGLLVSCPAALHAAQTTIFKADTTTMNSPTADWSAATGGAGGFVAPATNSIGRFDATISAVNAAALTLGGNIQLDALQFAGTLNGPVTIGGANTLTLGASAGTTGFDLSTANTNVIINCPLLLIGGDNTVFPVVNSGITLTLNGAISSTAALVPSIISGNNGNGGVVNINGGGVITNGTYFSVNSGTVNINTNALTVSPNYRLNVGWNNANPGILNVSNTTLTMASAVEVDIGGGYNGAQTNGTGTINLGGTLATPGLFNLGTTAGTFKLGVPTSASSLGSGTINLNTYGTLATSRSITVNSLANTAFINFNGGTLKLTAAQGTMIGSGILVTNTSAGGTIDCQTFAGTVVAPINGIGGLTKLGSGTLTLSGANTYSGSTTVSVGKLVTTTASIGAGAYTVANGATLNVKVSALGKTLTNSSLTLGTSAATTLEFDNGALANPTAVIVTNSSLTLNGTVTVNIYGSALSVGTIDLLAYGSKSGSGTWLLGSLPPGVGATLNDTGTKLQLVVSTANTSLLWRGNVSSAWDIGNSGNATWLGLPSSVSAYYVESAQGGVPVTFDDTATGSTAITLGVAVKPTSVTLSNNSAVYSLTGAGKISGSIGITKNGTGTFTIGTANDFSGTTTINAGILALAGGDNRLPTNTTVSFGNTAALNLGGNNQTLAKLALTTTNNTTTISNGTLTVQSANDLNLTPAPNNINLTNTLNMSGLASFTYNSSTKNVVVGGGGTNANVLNWTLSAGSNSLTANYLNLSVGGSGGNAPYNLGALFLGRTNIFNIGNGTGNAIFMGGYRGGNNNITFQPGLSNPGLRLRASDGVSRAGDIQVSQGSSGTGTLQINNLDFGIADVLAGNIILADNVQGGAGVNITGTMSMSGGSLNVTNIILGRNNNTAPSNVGNLTGSFTQNGGTVTAATVTFGLDLATNTPTGTLPNFISTYTLNGGTLAAQTLVASPDGWPVRNTSVQTVIWNNGTIRNYNSLTPLLVSNVNLTATTTNAGRILWVDAGLTNTILSRILQGSAYALPVIKDGAGTLDLQGATDNSYFALNVSNGVVLLDKQSTTTPSVHAIGSGLTLNGGTVILAATYTGDQIYDGNLVTLNSGTFDLNGQTETIGGLAGTGGTLTDTLGGGTLTVNVATGTNYTSAATLTHGNLVIGLMTGGGQGTQIFTGTDNRVSETTTINSGTLQIGNGGTGGNLAGSAVTVNSPGFLAFDNSGTLNFAGSVNGNGSVAQNGIGKLTLTGGVTYTGNTLVNAGTLAVASGATTIGGSPSSITVASNATFDVTGGAGGFLVQSGQTLNGWGAVKGSYLVGFGATNAGNLTVTGDVTLQDGSVLNPGAAATFSAGTITVNGNVALASGNQSLIYKLASANTPGGGTNSLLAVSGNLDFSAGIPTLIIQGTPTAGTYVLATFGSFTGSASQLVVPGGGTYTFTPQIGGGGHQLQLVVVGTPKNLVWQGDGGANIWDANNAGNPDWFNLGTSAADFFSTADNVIFNDTSVNVTVNINATVDPSSLTVSNSAGSYTFIGAGAIDGLIALTKINSGALDIQNNNTFVGPVNINGGMVTVASVAAIGTPQPLGAGSALNFNGGTFQYTGPAVGGGEFSRTVSLSANGGTIDQSGSGAFFQTNQISGGGSLTKIGTGQLILGDLAGGTGNNTYSGITFVTNGQIQLRNTNALGSVSGKTVVTEPGNVAAGGGLVGTIAEPFDLSGLGDGKGALQANDGGAGVTFTGTIDLVTNAGIGGGSTLTIAGPLTGPGMLTKAGGGTTILLGTPTYTGGTEIAGGTLQLGTNGTTGWLPAQPVGVALTNNSVLAFARSDTNIYAGNITGTGRIQQNGSGVVILSGTNDFTGQVNFNNATAGTLRAAVNGALGLGNIYVQYGTVELAGNCTISNPVIQLNMHTYATPTPHIRNVSGTNVIVGNLDLEGGGATWEVSSVGGYLIMDGNLLPGAGAGGNWRTLYLDGPAGGRINGVYDRSLISPPAVVLLDVRSGTWTLGTNNLYGGNTAVETGATLLVDNTDQTIPGSATDTGAVNVSGTLGGDGFIGGPVTVNTGGKLSPGMGGIGTLTLNGNLTLAGSLFMEVNKSLAQSNDFVVVNGLLLTNTAAGTVTVTNLDYLAPLVVGDRFTLFSQAVSNGAALHIVGGGPSVTWTNNLAVDGSITVLSVTPPVTVNTNTFTITNTVSGSNLNLSWPSDRLGWRLQVQTNSLNSGLGTVWYDWPNSTNLTSVSIPLNPANPSVFLRMVYP